MRLYTLLILLIHISSAISLYSKLTFFVFAVTPNFKSVACRCVRWINRIIFSVHKGRQVFWKMTIFIIIAVHIVIQATQLPLITFILWNLIRLCSVCKKYKSPQFRIMNIYNSGRRPDPVVLRQCISIRVTALYIGVILYVHFPLYARKINAVILAAENGITTSTDQR